MTIGIVAKLKCKEGMNAEFEAGFKKLHEVVKENEPGCIMYLLHKSRTDDTAYVVMEQYEDEEALKLHGSYDAFKETGAGLGPSSGGRPQVEIVDLV